MAGAREVIACRRSEMVRERNSIYRGRKGVNAEPQREREREISSHPYVLNFVRRASCVLK